MSNVTILTILAIIYLGVVRLAQFMVALFVIAFVGLITFRTIRDFIPLARQRAA